jgi:CRISPR/Cas system-associated exonuclease Cas4 (RecB family)
MSDYKLIQASEIGEYVYCNHAWWLRRVQGMASRHAAQMAAGTAFHEEHGRTVGRSLTLRKLATALLLAGSATLFLWLMG